MRRNLKVILLVVVFIGLLAGSLLLVKHKKEEISQVSKYGSQPRPVTAIRAQKGNLVKKKDYLAIVEPGLKAQVSSRVSAEIEKVHVDEGDKVKFREALVELDSEEIRHKLESIKYMIQEAQADLAGNRATVKALENSYKYWRTEKKRYQSLVKKGAVSKSDTERIADKTAEIRGRLTAAREKNKAFQERIASLGQQKDEIQASLDYYSIQSPYEGIVSDRMVDPGDLASPSQVLLEIEDREKLKISFDIPQEDLSEIRQGQKVIFSLKGQKHKAEISLVYPSLNKVRMKRAEVWLQGKNALTPGAYLPISVIVKRLKDTTLLPRSSLIPSPQGKKYVFAVKQGRLKATAVEILGYSKDQVAVKGLSPGTQVVRNTFLGWNRLSSGEKVEVIR